MADSQKGLNRRQRQAIETKLRITEVATNLFREQGFSSLTVQDICRHADISVGTFYHHFASKEEIINTAHSQVDILLEERLRVGLAAFYREGKTLGAREEVLYCLGEAGALLQELNWDFVNQAYRQLLNSTSNKYTLLESRPIFQRILGVIEGGCRDGELAGCTRPRQLAHDLMRCSRGVIFDWCLQGGTYRLKEQMQADLKILLDHYHQRKDSREDE